MNLCRLESEAVDDDVWVRCQASDKGVSDKGDFKLEMRFLVHSIVERLVPNMKSVLLMALYGTVSNSLFSTGIVNIKRTVWERVTKALLNHVAVVRVSRGLGWRLRLSYLFLVATGSGIIAGANTAEVVNNSLGVCISGACCVASGSSCCSCRRSRSRRRRRDASSSTCSASSSFTLPPQSSSFP